jgi:signal transduction histidine kinase
VVCIERDITAQKLNEQRLIKVNAELFSALADLKNTHEELRALQMQLIEAEKMKSIGRLAAGIAHEVKNPLAVIRMGADFLSKHSAAADPTVRAVIGEMLQSVERADAVIRGLLDYSAPHTLELAEAGLNEIVQQALTLVRGEMLAGRHFVVTELKEGLPPLKVDALKISQVVVNLIVNALHAMEDGGTLTIRTRTRQITGVGPNIGDSRSEAFHAGDRVVCLDIEDTGPGIPADMIPKLFDPFFTTKPTGKGTGLGLTVAKSIIDLHRGTIEVANKPEGGARMTVTLKI